ncbi:MAG: hypothetical protein AABX82_02495 [Nanoarchaeota archaeon]
MREKTAQEVYDFFLADGEFKINEVDFSLIRKMRNAAVENAEYIEFLLKQQIVNWRVIYTLYYDVLRELCEALIKCNGIKISNHQGCFAYICIKFPELELDWNFFERIRNTRNRNKYEGKDIIQQDWKEIQLQLHLYVSTIKKVLEEKLNETEDQQKDD